MTSGGNHGTSFLQVTREERFFCSVLMHVLLAYPRSASGILELFTSQADGLVLVSDDLEVYTEVAALRDVWAGLGKAKNYSPELHAERRAILRMLLAASAGYAGSDTDVEDLARRWPQVFMSPGASPKLVSPGKWPLMTDPHVAGLSLVQLRTLKWAFNAKPDLLLVTKGHGIIIEAKVKSGFGANGKTGYGQKAVQETIAALLPVILPEQFAIPPVCLTLAGHQVDARTNTTWTEVIEVVDASEVDDFSYRALTRAAFLTR